MKWKSLSCIRLRPHGLYSPWNSPGQNTGVCSLSLLQGIFPTQRSNPGLLHCRWILYHLSHKESPRVLEWVAYPFSSASSQPRNRTWSPALQADSLPTELWGKSIMCVYIHMCRYFCDSVEKFLWLLWHLPVLHCIFSSHWLSSFAWAWMWCCWDPHPDLPSFNCIPVAISSPMEISPSFRFLFPGNISFLNSITV